MENIKSAPLEYKREPATPTQSPSPAALICTGHLSAGKTVLLCRRVPTVRPELLLGGRLGGLEPLVYRDTGELAEVGFGQHAELRLASPCTTVEATERIKRFAARALRPATLVAVGSTDGTESNVLARYWQPRVHAAFAFASTEAQPERPLSALWQPFGGAYALVPALSYVQVRGGSYLCHLLEPTDKELVGSSSIDLAVKHALERLDSAELSLLSLEVTPSGSASKFDPETSNQIVAETGRTIWDERVTRALESIHRGELEKVVPARFAEHAFGKPVSVVSALYALGNTHPNSTKFAFMGPKATFLGATPEHLISKSGPTLTTEALAGTTASSNGSLQSFTAKEYHEHTPVLDAILSSLAPFCSQLTHEVTPLPLRLPHVLHLRTAISGTLSDPRTHVLDLVNALHPTPAVAGAPRMNALQWLAQNEDFDRGWYAGPIGWFDVDGNGQFDVALRCGVLTDDRVVLFAGAGIVSGSIAQNEFEETVLKLKAMQTALSAPTPDVSRQDAKG